MAKIKQGILGGFSGKVANVVGTSWKGRAVMKSQPLSVSNPRTEDQVAQRNKFSKIAELAGKILTQFVQPVENPISGNISGYNLFCKDNKAAFDAVGALVAANLCAGGGKIINIVPTSIEAIGGGSAITMRWTNAAGTSALRLTDKVFAFAVDEETGEVAVTDGTATRNSQVADLFWVNAGVKTVTGHTCAIVYACVSADGRDVSVKTFATEETAS